MKLVWIFIVVFFASASFAAVPLSQREKLFPLEEKAILKLPTIDKSSLAELPQKRLSESGKVILRPHKISETAAIAQSIEELGQWQSVNGEEVWRLKIKGANALHLNLGFNNVHLPESARLYITDSKTGELLKQYSTADNKSHGQLWTPLFTSNDLHLELNIDSIERKNLQFEILQAGQGTKAFTADTFNTKSGSCNIDVACPEGNGWENEIRAVAKYTISDSTGTFACTGTLMNNSRGDMMPLFLTAAHCLVSDTTDASMVFYWNYETSVCDGIPDGSLDQSQSGSTFISRWDNLETGSDFALVKLDDMPSTNFNVYYSGWDNRDQSYTGARVIHHPLGSVNPQNSEKRISIENDTLTITTYNGTEEDLTANYLQVGAWDAGTTEGGSSGAGLWNTNHRLIANLSGGSASCSELTEPDWFGRFASHWLGNGNRENQLAAYLAPDNIIIATLDGVNSCDAPSVSITSSNASPMQSEQVSFTSTVTAGTPGYTYEWDFDSDGTVDSTDANPVHTYTDISNNMVTLVIRDSTQCPSIAQTGILVADTTEAFIGDGVLPNGFAKASTAEGSWIVDDGNASEGLFSLKSQIVNGDNTSAIELTGNYQAGTLTFDRRVSSEVDKDLYKFYIDDIEQFSISGEQDWDSVSYAISQGNHTFRWSFEKDISLSSGQDAAWIDNLNFTVTPTPPSNGGGGGGGGSMGYLLILLLLLRRYKY